MSAKPKEPKRTRLAPAVRRSQLLDVGYEILLNEPLENLTVDRVAAVADLVIRIAEASVAGSDRDDRVRRGVDAFITYIQDRAQTFVAMSAPSHTG